MTNDEQIEKAAQEVFDIMRPKVTPEQLSLIQNAYTLAREAHKGQMRKGGDPYIVHPIAVAKIVAQELELGANAVCAAFLHDVVEDTDTSVEDISRMFSPEVARLVDSLTKIQRLKLSKIDAKDFEAEDHRKILIGMAKDIRVIIIKLADRLHNMRTLAALSPERQIALSKETSEVFIPIAHRLGLEAIKNELADICLSYLEPVKFDEVKKLLSKKTKIMNKALEGFKKKIADLLFEKGIEFEISARVKSINSIYNKIYNKQHSFSEIYDIMALRIITDGWDGAFDILPQTDNMNDVASPFELEWTEARKTIMESKTFMSLVGNGLKITKITVK